MKFDPVEFAKGIGDMVKGLLRPFERRLDALEGAVSRSATPPGDVPVEVPDARISEAVKQYLIEHPPKDGETPVVDVEAAARALAGCEEVRTVLNLLVAEAVEEYAKAHPPEAGKDGVGVDGAELDTAGNLTIITSDGKAHKVGCVKGEDGKDAADVTGGMIDKGGNLILTTSDGKTHNLGRVEGKDGLGFDDVSATWDKEAQEIVMRYARGELVKEVRYPAPAPTHAGFWQAGMQVKCGAFATHNGSLWYAMRTTSEEPTYQSKDWQLAARKGADGQHKTVKVDRDE